MSFQISFNISSCSTHRSSPGTSN